MCLSLLNDGWTPALTIKHVLLRIQTLLDEPSIDVYAAGSLHPAAAYTLYTTIRAEYDQRVRAQMLLLSD